MIAPGVWKKITVRELRSGEGSYQRRNNLKNFLVIKGNETLLLSFCIKPFIESLSFWLWVKNFWTSRQPSSFLIYSCENDGPMPPSLPPSLCSSSSGRWGHGCVDPFVAGSNSPLWSTIRCLPCLYNLSSIASISCHKQSKRRRRHLKYFSIVLLHSRRRFFLKKFIGLVFKWCSSNIL